MLNPNTWGLLVDFSGKRETGRFLVGTLVCLVQHESLGVRALVLADGGTGLGWINVSKIIWAEGFQSEEM